ncbi:F-actin-uncapping protein LRRC16A [Amphibalanus amphitrite]|uniref:F-actin-uncapping protein LRRC16A n=1 Tax=Amphibalanus amphitrite TaxID=1232801 RepID=A0A6A4X8Z4_AMPAM|nr:F-actin-uncapping protein LRRC16A [Amphibalanus amphitrite]
MVLDLRSHPPLGSSDHVVLTFTLRCYAEVEQVTTLKPALHRGDYGAMVQMAREATWPVSDGCTVDQHYRAFQEVLDGICERGIPRQHPGGRKRNLYMTREALTLQNQSIRSCLGRSVKISMKCMVRMETKQDKFENRVLIDHHFHYLDIQAIESKHPNEFCLVVNDKRYTFIPADERHNEIDAMITNLGVSIKNVFPTVPLSHIVRKVEVVPARRLQKLHEVARLVEAREPVPCGGFSTQYACMCDYHNLPYRDEVAWDVDTIYLSHDSRELSLQDFDHLDPKDLVPIISALEYNTWFTKLRISHLRLSHEAAERLLHVLKKSVSLEEVYLDNTGLKADYASKLSMALLANSSSLLTVLDVSHNPIEDKGASHLTGPVGRAAKGLRQLAFSHCGLTAKGVNHLCHALSLNRTMATTLTTLDLSGNNMKEEVTNLYNFLAQPNAVQSLNVSSCDLLLDSIFGALLRGCTQNLSRLDISKNVFNTKKSKDIPPSFKQFFTSTIALKYLNCSGCRMPLEALKNLLLGLACNESTEDVELDLSSNGLGSTGAHVLESCIHGVKCVSSLDISENGLEQDLSGVVTAVSRNKSVRTLKMGRNLVNIKSKHVHHVVEAVVQMIQEDDCMVEVLHLNDSRLKSDLYSLLNALGSNSCLQTLDISGNLMGDTGARLLSKALQINCRLRQICLDRNGISLQGLSDIAYGLQCNYTLKYIPAPLHDLTPCMKLSPERTEAVWRRLQDLLHRNTAPRGRPSGQAFRLQQGLLLSSAQQMLDRLVAQIREQVRTLREAGGAATEAERPPEQAIARAEAVCGDAQRCKQSESVTRPAAGGADGATKVAESPAWEPVVDFWGSAVAGDDDDMPAVRTKRNWKQEEEECEEEKKEETVVEEEIKKKKESEEKTVKEEKDNDAMAEIRPRKVPPGVPAGFMGELMSQLRKSRTEGDVLVGKKKARKHHRVEVDDTGKMKMKKLKRRMPKLQCDHGFCDKLMSRLHAVVTEREAAGSPVELRLSQVAEELHTVIAEHIEGTVDRMLDTAEAECPHVLVSSVREAVRATGAERLRLALPSEKVGAGLQRAGSELAERVNELHLNVAGQVSDRIVDEVIESLTRSYQELTGDVTRRRACTPDVLKSHPRLSGDVDSVGGGGESSRSREDVTSEQSSDLSPPATPQLHAKKLNLQGRKTRPKSVVADSVEGVSADHFPDLLPSLEDTEEEIDTVSELPAPAHQLRHLGKARPRRAKSRAPTRPVVGEEGAGLDSGLDAFFPPARSLPSSPLTSPDSESRQLMTTSADNTPHLGLDRTRRSSALRDDESQRDRKSSGGAGSGGGVKKGISSVFSKLAADRVARSREDRDGDGGRSSGRKGAGADTTADSDSSAGSGSADSFLNHLLSPVVVPPPGEGDSTVEPAALRRPAGLGGSDLLAEMRAKQEKRASLTPKHTPEELEERSPLQEVKGRAAALAAAAAIKSPPAAPHGPPSISPKPSLASKPKQASPLPGQGRPPPLPPGPKPRPRSMAARTEHRHSGGGSVSSGEAEDAGVAASPPAVASVLCSLYRCLTSLMESSVDGPPPVAALNPDAAAAGAVPVSPVPKLVLDPSFSLDDVINV